MVVKQVERDNRVNALVATMASMYGFLQDANPLEKIKSYEQTVERLVRQTAECAYFIAEYSKTESFGECVLLKWVNVTKFMPHSSSTNDSKRHVQRRHLNCCLRSFFWRAEGRVYHGIHFADGIDNCLYP